jgi:hypothetical protein
MAGVIIFMLMILIYKATPVGLDANGIKQAILSPNPNDGSFNLSLLSSLPNCSLKIYNLLGRIYLQPTLK